jgi:hypothetical protein
MVSFVIYNHKQPNYFYQTLVILKASSFDFKTRSVRALRITVPEGKTP